MRKYQSISSMTGIRYKLQSHPKEQSELQKLIQTIVRQLNP